jgi:hypothetical protein
VRLKRSFWSWKYEWKADDADSPIVGVHAVLVLKARTSLAWTVVQLFRDALLGTKMRRPSRPVVMKPRSTLGDVMLDWAAYGREPTIYYVRRMVGSCVLPDALLEVFRKDCVEMHSKVLGCLTVVVVDAGKFALCSGGCGGPGWMRCGGGGGPKCCLSVRYCSRACQREHWVRGHRHECARLGLGPSCIYV